MRFYLTKLSTCQLLYVGPPVYLSTSLRSTCLYVYTPIFLIIYLSTCHLCINIFICIWINTNDFYWSFSLQSETAGLAFAKILSIIYSLNTRKMCERFESGALFSQKNAFITFYSLYFWHGWICVYQKLISTTHRQYESNVFWINLKGASFSQKLNLYLFYFLPRFTEMA